MGGKLAFDGRHKLVQGFDPSKRRGGHEWEQSDDPEEMVRLQRTRSELLLDVAGSDERVDLSSVRPTEKSLLDAALRSLD
jgi:hypothetical protein